MAIINDRAAHQLITVPVHLPFAVCLFLLDQKSLNRAASGRRTGDSRQVEWWAQDGGAAGQCGLLFETGFDLPWRSS